MSPKTTLVLLAIFAALVVAVTWTRRNDVSVDPADRRLVTASALRELSSIRFVPGESRTPKLDPFTLDRTSDGTWALVSPAVLDGKPVPAREDRCLSLVDVLRDAAFVRTLDAGSPDNSGAFGLVPTQGDRLEVATPGGPVRLVFGFDVDGNGVAVRRGDGWPPVVVDRAVLDEVRRPATDWWERRMIPAEVGEVRGVVLSGSAGRLRLVRESGRWLLSEPAIARADPGRAERLAAWAVGAAAKDGRAADPPASASRIEVSVERAGKATSAFSAAFDGASMWLRRGGDAVWVAAAAETPDVFRFGADDFRSRRVFDVEASDLESVAWTRRGSPRTAYRRIGGQWFFEPPEEWGWTDLAMKRPLLPLDPLVGPRFLETLAATEVDALHAPRPYESDWSVTYAGSKGGVDTTRGGFKAGLSADGSLHFESAGGAFGTFRKNGLSAFEVPWWTLLAKSLNSVAPWSITEIEVSDATGRRVALRASAPREGGFDYMWSTPESPEGRPAPRERVDAVLARLTSLAAKRFVGMQAPETARLATPRLVIRWRDTVQRSERDLTTRPANGRWYTWRVGAEDGEGGAFGDYPDSLPGLCFTTELRDLDPFLDLLAPP